MILMLIRDGKFSLWKARMRPSVCMCLIKRSPLLIDQESWVQEGSDERGSLQVLHCLSALDV